MPIPKHDRLAHKCLLYSLILRHAKEYSRTTCVFSLAPTSFDTILALIALHLESNGYFSFFLKDYEPNQDLELSYNSFKLAFHCMPHLSTSGPFKMVFKCLRNCFHLKNSTSGFLQLFQLFSHIT
jgi:hypothetical protein